MNRRYFLRTFGWFVLVFVILPTSALMSACSGESVQTALNTILSSIIAILGVADKTASWYQALVNAFAALKGAETGWQAGGPVVLIDDALNTVSAVLGEIPVTAIYAPLIAILVAGIEACLALIPQPTPAAAAKSFNAHAQRAANNHFYGKVALDKPSLLHPTHEGAYRHQWDSTAKAIGLPQAKI